MGRKETRFTTALLYVATFGVCSCLCNYRSYVRFWEPFTEKDVGRNARRGIRASCKAQKRVGRRSNELKLAGGCIVSLRTDGYVFY